MTDTRLETCWKCHGVETVEALVGTPVCQACGGRGLVEMRASSEPTPKVIPGKPATGEQESKHE